MDNPNENTGNDSRLQSVENAIGRIENLLVALTPVASFVPGGAAVAAVASTVLHGADAVIDAMQSESAIPAPPAGVDPAALAASDASRSTGNPDLDARLLLIESKLQAIDSVVEVIESFAPAIAWVRKEFGLG